MPTYLHRLLASEFPYADMRCQGCHKGEAKWRCLECFGSPFECTDCCRRRHRQLPRHRVQEWVGNYFEPSWLRFAGVEIFLGHHGNPCPKATSAWAEGDETDLEEDYVDIAEGEEDGGEKYQAEGLVGGIQPEVRPSAAPLTVVVDRSGVHRLPINYCTCAGAPDREYQLFNLGLFPTTSTNPKTVFTFAVLDDFLIDNLKSKTLGQSYYRKIRKITRNVFPQTVVVSSYSSVEE